MAHMDVPLMSSGVRMQDGSFSGDLDVDVYKLIHNQKGGNLWILKI